MRSEGECDHGRHEQILADRVATATPAVLNDSEEATEDSLCPLRSGGWCVPCGAVSTLGGGGTVPACEGGSGLQMENCDDTVSSGEAHSFQKSDSTPTHNE